MAPAFEPLSAFYRLRAKKANRSGLELSATFLAILSDMEAAQARAEPETESEN